MAQKHAFLDNSAFRLETFIIIAQLVSSPWFFLIDLTPANPASRSHAQTFRTLFNVHMLAVHYIMFSCWPSTI